MAHTYNIVRQPMEKGMVVFNVGFQKYCSGTSYQKRRFAKTQINYRIVYSFQSPNSWHNFWKRYFNIRKKISMFNADLDFFRI